MQLPMRKFERVQTRDGLERSAGDDAFANGVDRVEHQAVERCPGRAQGRGIEISLGRRAEITYAFDEGRLERSEPPYHRLEVLDAARRDVAVGP